MCSTCDKTDACIWHSGPGLTVQCHTAALRDVCGRFVLTQLPQLYICNGAAAPELPWQISRALLAAWGALSSLILRFDEAEQRSDSGDGMTYILAALRASSICSHLTYLDLRMPRPRGPHTRSLSSRR